VELSLGDIGWRAHPEVWVLIIGLGALAWYGTKVLQPKAAAAGFGTISRRQKAWFLAATLGVWAASDWPVHDVGEEYLYVVHMVQHLLISMLIPGMFMLSMPRWLFDLLVPEGGRARALAQKASRPIAAGLMFNALTIGLHFPGVVQLSFDNGAFHYAVHLLVFVAGLLMWAPIIGPVEEWRLPPIGQCIFLFMMSIVPTVPSGWLIFAENVVYQHYDTVDRLWGFNAINDQQAAGVVMKLVGGFFLWAVIVVIFARWASAESAKEAALSRANRVPAPTVDLTFEEVSEQFARTEAPAERTP